MRPRTLFLSLSIAPVLSIGVLRLMPGIVGEMTVALAVAVSVAVISVSIKPHANERGTVTHLKTPSANAETPAATPREEEQKPPYQSLLSKQANHNRGSLAPLADDALADLLAIPTDTMRHTILTQIAARWGAHDLCDLVPEQAQELWLIDAALMAEQDEAEKVAAHFQNSDAVLRLRARLHRSEEL